MNSLKKSLLIVSGLALIGGSVFALEPKETARYYNGPTVSSVTGTTAEVSLSQAVLNGITDEEKSSIYFEYYETNKVCIAIYPTPEACLPKKTEVGKLATTLKNLTPNTSYTIFYKRDNTIRCITTPCPENGYESMRTEFTTKKDGQVSPGKFLRNLGFLSYGTYVTALQNTLRELGYFNHSSTGYFGMMTFKAVKEFQRAHNISPTGFVGPLTRQALENKLSLPEGEIFEGKITAYSTACFADGECSISVDGKKVVTVIGWSQAVVGQVLGIPDLGAVENKIGASAKVYAKKTLDGYTLYGSKDYYIQVK